MSVERKNTLKTIHYDRFKPPCIFGSLSPGKRGSFPGPVLWRGFPNPPLVDVSSEYKGSVRPRGLAHQEPVPCPSSLCSKYLEP